MQWSASGRWVYSRYVLINFLVPNLPTRGLLSYLKISFRIELPWFQVTSLCLRLYILFLGSDPWPWPYACKWLLQIHPVLDHLYGLAHHTHEVSIFLPLLTSWKFFTSASCAFGSGGTPLAHTCFLLAPTGSRSRHKMPLRLDPKCFIFQNYL